MIEQIIIDKIKLVADCSKISKTTRYDKKSQIEDYLSQYFDEKFFRVEIGYKWFKIKIYPTYFNFAKHNLEAITQEELLNLLQNIETICKCKGRYKFKFHLQEIHLTKDRFMSAPASEYIHEISNHNMRIKPIIYCRPKKNYNVSFTSLKADNIEQDYKQKRLVKLYDKLQQLKDTKNFDIEKVQFRHRATSNLKDTNLLRIEEEFVTNKMIKKLLPKDAKGGTDEITLECLIKLLQEKNLYKLLDMEFTKQFKEMFGTETKSNHSKLPMCQKLRELDFTELMPIGYLSNLNTLLCKLKFSNSKYEIFKDCNQDKRITEILNKFLSNF